MLLDSGATGLVMSLDFAKKNKFKTRRLKRLMFQEIQGEDVNRYNMRSEVECYIRDVMNGSKTVS